MLLMVNRIIGHIKSCITLYGNEIEESDVNAYLTSKLLSIDKRIKYVYTKNSDISDYNESSKVWVIDQYGLNNRFIFNRYIAVSLWAGKEYVLSVIYFVDSKIIYSAENDKGVWSRNALLKARKSFLIDSKVALYFDRLDDRLPILFDRFINRSKGIHILDSIVMGACSLINKEYGLVYLSCLSYAQLACALPLILEAGACYVVFENEVLNDNKMLSIIFACSKELANEAVEIIDGESDGRND